METITYKRISKNHLRNVYVRTPHGFVYFRSIKDARTIFVISLLEARNRLIEKYPLLEAFSFRRGRRAGYLKGYQKAYNKTRHWENEYLIVGGKKIVFETICVLLGLVLAILIYKI